MAEEQIISKKEEVEAKVYYIEVEISADTP